MSTAAGDWVPAPGTDKTESQSLILTKNGQPAALLANAISALRGPLWKGVFAFDEFAWRAVVQGKPPWGGDACNVTDHQDRLCCEWLQHQNIFVSSEVAGQAIQVVARDRLINPPREYLERLNWDGTKRADTWLSLYLGVEPSDFSAAVGERWLRSAVARILRPGSKCDCCLILEGKQGTLKSTALKVLGNPWHTDELAELGSKDASLQTAGIWIIEIAELDGLTRSEVGKIKAFMSRTVDRFRPPYGRHVILSPRQCVFAGSVNHNVYLRDETGGRRFWPVACGLIRIDELARDRDQIWAESVVTYRAGAPWWLESAALNAQAEDEQAERYEGSAWDSLILEWAEEQLRTGADDSVSTAEILEKCIRKARGQWLRSDEMRVAACLRTARWERYRDWKRGWRFKPPPTYKVGEEVTV